MVKRKRLDIDQDLLNAIERVKMKMLKVENVKLSDRDALKMLVGETTKLRLKKKHGKTKEYIIL